MELSGYRAPIKRGFLPIVFFLLGPPAHRMRLREQTLQRTPLRRLGTPEDIARTVRFLALDAPFITGEIVAVDGGRKLVL